ncbi:MAG: oligopeptide transporter, OPT family [Firmicutes bacterium]|nr:oligopeptide transporter, OPT family [Bacillota bacterium]
MEEHKGLPEGAYEGKTGEEYIPYIPAEKNIPELTATSIIMGIIQAAIFGMVMAYLGLKVGMTVSASIPAAVISMGILRGLFKRGTILENNIVQTIASAGEAVAGGIIFTIPALYIWKNTLHWDIDINYLQILAITLLGGVLGVLFMIPLRKYLIIKEHGKLLYPEGTACAEVLVAGDVGGSPAKLVFSGILISSVYKFLMGAVRLWKETVEWPFWKAENGVVSGIKNLVLKFDLLPSLLGVGFIIGIEVSAYMLAGGVLAWFVIIPLISYIGSNLPNVIPPATVPISSMGPDQIWNNYIRYIGAGAVAFGGIASLTKAMPTIIKSFQLGIAELLHGLRGTKRDVTRTGDDLPMAVVVAGSLVIAVIIGAIPQLHVGLVGALMVVVFGFLFATVSSRVVGIVGSSSNPVSGMTIGTLLVTCLIFLAAKITGTAGMVAALFVGAIVCVGIGIAGDTSQDLKTGFLVGATPKYQQYGMIIGVLSSSALVVWTVLKLCDIYGMPSKELVAPQANLMSIIIPGVMQGNIPWTLFFIGVFAALVSELMKVPALPFAVGLYLPLELSTTVMVGGVVSWMVHKFNSPGNLKSLLEKGILVASGLIAGDAIMGIIVAILDSKKIDLGEMLKNATGFGGSSHNLPSVAVFLLMVAYLIFHTQKKSNNEKSS